jgi:hypothetical protein
MDIGSEYYIFIDDPAFLVELSRLTASANALLMNQRPTSLFPRFNPFSPASLQEILIGSMSDDELAEFLVEFDLGNSQLSNTPTTITEEQFSAYKTMKYGELPESMRIYDSCPIATDKFESNDNICILPCNHYYLLDDIHQWLTKYSDCCPYCKRTMQSDSEPN